MVAREAESRSARITPLMRHKKVTSDDTVTSYYPKPCQRRYSVKLSDLVIAITLFLEHTSALACFLLHIDTGSTLTNPPFIYILDACKDTSD